MAITLLDEAGHDALDHTGLTGVGPGGSSAGTGILIPVPGIHFITTGASSIVADAAYMHPIIVPVTMYLRACVFSVSNVGSGTHEWGLFDASADPTAATKLAGGSGALGSTGAIAIAASGGPITIAPGGYVLIYKGPSSNSASLDSTSNTRATGYARAHTSYTWDDTPDVTAVGWATGTIVKHVHLKGDLDASGTTW